jgi:beta-fructofuranosidase
MKNGTLTAVLNAVKENQKNFNQDAFKNNYHLQSPVGLINDPNGLIFYKGLYHVFFQWNPFETSHGNKFWGHFTSPDLITWNHEKAALAPGEWYDKDGCYSGTAFVKGEKLYLFYTGNVKSEEGREAYQCLAVSENGFDFTKKGPVIHLPEGYTAHFRDPKVFEKSGEYFMLIGAQNLQKKGEIVLYRSRDLTDWEFSGTLKSAADLGLDYFGYMWECPDIFEVEDGRYVLIFSPQGLVESEWINEHQSFYFTGDMDFETPVFKQQFYGKLDHGFDFYAPQILKDDNGRHLLIAWMGPGGDTDKFHPTLKNNWIHTLTLPRVITVKGEKVFQNPPAELEQLREDYAFFSSEKDGPKEVVFTGLSREIEIIVENTSGFRIAIGDGLELGCHYHTFYVRRKIASGGEWNRKEVSVHTFERIRLFIDKSTVEIFINEGETVFSLRYFPSIPEERILFQAAESSVYTLSTWRMRPMKMTLGDWK